MPASFCPFVRSKFQSPSWGHGCQAVVPPLVPAVTSQTAELCTRGLLTLPQVPVWSGLVQSGLLSVPSTSDSDLEPGTQVP